MMGDNRDNSQDSRFIGAIPETHLVGEAVRIWMHMDGLELAALGPDRHEDPIMWCKSLIRPLKSRLIRQIAAILQALFQVSELKP